MLITTAHLLLSKQFHKLKTGQHVCSPGRCFKAISSYTNCHIPLPQSAQGAVDIASHHTFISACCNMRMCAVAGASLRLLGPLGSSFRYCR